MKNEISKLFYNNMTLIYYCEEAIACFRIHNFYEGLHYYTKILDNMMSTASILISEEEYFKEHINLADINKLLIRILEANENKDYVLISDIFEMHMIPFLQSIQVIIMKEDQNELIEHKYRKNLEWYRKHNLALAIALDKLGYPIAENDYYLIEQTLSGKYTLALYDKEKRYYLHSIKSVEREAATIAKEWFLSEKESYVIYGLGLGHHIMALLELDTEITVTVLESNLNIIQLASSYGVIDELIASDRFTLVYDPYFSEFSQGISASKETIFYIYFPSIRGIINKNVRERIEDYFINYSSIKNQERKLYNNYKRNSLLNDLNVDILKEEFCNKDLFIIAGGPSLDKNFHILNKVKKSGIILAVGTVYKKLLTYNIKPDYIIITDPEEFVYAQVEGVENVDIPLIYLSTVYYKVPASYKGKRYLVCQEGYYRAEKYAKDEGCHLYQTGGSVTTTALDIGIYFQCKRIIFLGLDLAYTNQQDHASDTAYVNDIYDNELRQVEDVYGNMVSTGKNLDIYRKWIEKRIEGIEGIEFIDSTEGGAKIKGMRITTLAELISN